MAAAGLTYDSFDTKGDISTLGLRWKKWKRGFELFLGARGNTPAPQKRSLLLHCGGLGLQDIFFTLGVAADASYEVSLTALDNYFKPKSNPVYERHVFHNVEPQEGEETSMFVTRLREQAELCDFGDVKDDMIRDHVVQHTRDRKLKEKFLQKQDLTLDNLIEIAKGHEVTKRQLQVMTDSVKTETVNAISKSKGAKKFGKSHNQAKQKEKKHSRTSTDSERRCYRCNHADHIASDPKCPARKEQCRACDMWGHREVCCKTKKKKRVNQIEREESDSDEYVFGVNTGKSAMIEVNVGGVCVQAVIDSGASCNIMDAETWNVMKKKRVKCEKMTTEHNKSLKLYTYSANEPLKILGIFTAKTHIKDKAAIEAEFVVIKGRGVPLLGKDTSEKLGILSLYSNSVTPERPVSGSVKPEDKLEYKSMYTGLGKLRNRKVTLHAKPDAKPVLQNARQLPFSQRPLVEAKIKELVELDIIEKAVGPTKFVSPIVVVPKPGGKEIRLCVDMRQVNEQIVRERFPIPTVDEILHEMNGAKVFSKLDLKWGFHQLELSEDSRDLTTFATHIGNFRYKRLNFGVTSAPELYQHTIHDLLNDIEGSNNMIDDIIIFADSIQEHDKRLDAVLSKLKASGMTLNAEKCVYRMNELQFLGFLLSEKGIGPAESKVSAVKNATEPKSAAEVRSFLGLVNFSARFIENLATKSEPLRKLTKKSEKFVWGKEQQTAFDQLKSDLSKAETLAYFDPEAETRIVVDASPVGLGAVLTQVQKGKSRVIHYASRSLSDVERRYSQTEKEALACVWACERFHLYVYGIEFILETDHKPLEFIYSKRSKPSARIERWVLRLQSYRFKIQYKPGTQNIADSLSRLGGKEEASASDADEYIYFIAKNAIPGAMTGREIEEASASDAELYSLHECIKSGQWDRCPNSVYKAVKDELTNLGKLILRGTRIVIPEKLRDHVLNLAHEGHQGIVKTKARLRSKVWWPGIDKDAEQHVRACRSCQLVGTPQVPEPLVRTKFPDKPWEDLAADLMGPLPSGESILVLVDYYSRYIEVAILKSTTSAKLIMELDRIFSIHGIPLSVRTDNATNLVSEEFEAFLTENGISHSNTTPLWPQANGEVERQNRTLLKILKIAHAEEKNMKRELYKFLLAYNSTPHQTTGIAPAELLFGRKIRTKMPELSKLDHKEISDHYSFQHKPVPEYKQDESVRDRDSERKMIGKEYADERRNAKESSVKVGDEVLVKDKKTNKLSLEFEKEPYKVLDKRGSQLTVQSPSGKTMKRNVTSTKPLISKQPVTNDIQSQCVSKRPKRSVRVPDWQKDYEK